MRILVAEDEVVSRRVLQKHLENWGHVVVTAANGVEAWTLFQNGEFSLVISDWMMPEMDGPELVRRIRSCQRPSYVYIILLTAKTQKEDIVHGMEAGADDFVSKPFDRDELRVRVRAGERVTQLEHNLARRNEELEAANARITSANLRMKRDLEAAAKIQESLLPTALPDVPGVTFAWSFRPCDELAGDILNVFPLDEKRIGLYVLDVSGHGVKAALLSVSLSRLLSPLTDQSSLLKQRIQGSLGYRLVPPDEVAEQLNRRFPLDAATQQFFTLLYGILNLETRQFRYVSAGHPGPIHLSCGAAPIMLEAAGFPVGVIPEPEYEEQCVNLQPGDRLYLYSDGIPEAIGASGSQFGEQAILQVLDQNRSAPLNNSVMSLLRAVEDWCGEVSLKDDVSILAIEMKHASSAPTVLSRL